MVKKSAKKDKQNYIEGLACQAQEAAESNNLKTLYNITKKLSGRKTNTNRPVRDKEGNMLSKPVEQLNRWREHFSELLSVTPVSTPPPHIEEGEELEVNLGPIIKQK